MKFSDEHIDQLFKNAANNFDVPPIPGEWEGIKKVLGTAVLSTASQAVAQVATSTSTSVGTNIFTNIATFVKTNIIAVTTTAVVSTATIGTITIVNNSENNNANNNANTNKEMLITKDSTQKENKIIEKQDTVNLLDIKKEEKVNTDKKKTQKIDTIYETRIKETFIDEIKPQNRKKTIVIDSIKK